NLQSLRLDPNTAGSGVPRYLVSSSDEKADGMDVAMQWHPTRAFTLNLVAAYIDSRYAHKIAASGADLSGQPTGVPKLSFTVGLQYVWHIHGGQLALNLSHAYRGKSRCNNDSKLQGTCQVSPNFRVGEATRRTDFHLDWSAPGGHWGMALYATNVFNKRYVKGVDNVATSVLGTPFATITPPRTYGVTLRLKY
ncbi:MAG TPA: TonB-dependent receptor, partial [Oleiagrimonas sp.]|nr:TonB-dependent receptor [Oleiagrimonas sp.]